MQIQLSSASKNQLQVQVYDLSGRLVQSETLSRGQKLYQIGVGVLNEGVYHIQINDGDGMSRKMFVKSGD